jgi:hypothetical protein
VTLRVPSAAATPPAITEFKGAALTDYTSTLARRFTTWFWVAISFSELTDAGTELVHGIQLSQGVYPRHVTSIECANESATSNETCPDGDMENIMWINGEAIYLNTTLTFMELDELHQIPMIPGQGQTKLGSRIKISSSDGRLSLFYTPIAEVKKIAMRYNPELKLASRYVCVGSKQSLYSAVLRGAAAHLRHL